VAARLHIADGRKNGKDDLVTERISASRPTSGYSPQHSPDQLSVRERLVSRRFAVAGA
jgi:hypothetical protein